MKTSDDGHSPLPWFIDVPEDDETTAGISDTNGDAVVWVHWKSKGQDEGITKQADAEFIVRAVNSHEFLVALLERCEETYGDLPYSVRQLADEARAALSKAKE